MLAAPSCGWSSRLDRKGQSPQNDSSPFSACPSAQLWASSLVLLLPSPPCPDMADCTANCEPDESFLQKSLLIWCLVMAMREEASVNWRGSFRNTWTAGLRRGAGLRWGTVSVSGGFQGSGWNQGAGHQCCVQGSLELLCLESVWLRPRVSGLQLQLFWGALETETVSGLFGDRLFVVVAASSLSWNWSEEGFCLFVFLPVYLKLSYTEEQIIKMY